MIEEWVVNEVAIANMSVREKPSTSAAGATFVRGGEALTAPNRRKQGDVNTTLGSVGFTAEETTSFYGKLVGLPSNVRLRTQLLPDVNPAAPLGNSIGWMQPAADVESRVSSICDPPNKLSESNIGFQVCILSSVAFFLNQFMSLPPANLRVCISGNCLGEICLENKDS